MNEENKKNYINNMPKEYRNLFISIKTCAESNKSLEIHLNQQECKLIMRYLFKNMSYKSKCEKVNKKLNELDFDNYIYGKHALKDIKKDLQNILNGD